MAVQVLNHSKVGEEESKEEEWRKLGDSLNALRQEMGDLTPTHNNIPIVNMSFSLLYKID